MMKTALLLAMLLVCRCGAAATSQPCASVPHDDHPKVVLSNGDAKAVLFMPDAKNGYYRGARFDWSGVVACVSFQGHTYFGEWFKKYDPLINDSITGPVEEFRSEDGAIGYSNALPGGLFVKPGVGVLRKVDSSPYKFGFRYPIVDSGKWTTRVQPRSVTFQQQLSGPDGIAYVYTKTVELKKHGGMLVLRHTLRNTGTAYIRTDVYDHDFFMLDGRPTGPGMRVRFAFEPVLQPPSDSTATPAARIEGKEIVYTRELAAGETFASYLTGYTGRPTDYDFTVEDRNTGVGVQQTSDSPVSRLYLWSIRSTICPEAYIHLDIPPGASQSWTIRYRFFGSAASNVP